MLTQFVAGAIISRTYGDFARGVLTLSVSFIPSGTTVHAPDLDPGSVTRAPGFIASGNVVQSPDLDATVTRSPSFIGSGNLVRTPDIDFDQELFPSFIASGNIVRQPDIDPGAVTRSPGFISSTVVVQQPDIDPGAVTRSPGFITATTVVRQPDLDPGAVTRVPGFISSTTIVRQPDIDPGSVTRIPAFIASAYTVGTPTYFTGETRQPSFIAAGTLVRSPSRTTGSVTRSPTFMASSYVVQTPDLDPTVTRFPDPVNRISGTFLQGAADTSDSLTYTFSSQSFGVPTSDRYIAVCIETRFFSGTPIPSLTSVTIGGVSATIVHQRTNGANCVGIAIAAVPTGTSGSVVVSVTNTGNTPPGGLRMGIQVYRLTGLSSSTPSFTTFDNSTDPTATFDIPAGAFVLSCAMAAGPSASTTWTGLNEDYDTQIESVISASSASQLFNTAQSGHTVTANPTGSTNPVAVFAVWTPATATVHTPAAQLGAITRAPGFISSTVVVRSPSYTTGAVTRSPSFIASGHVVQVPSVLQQQIRAVAFIASSNVVQTPDVDLGAATRSPLFIASTAVVRSPAFTPGSLTVSVAYQLFTNTAPSPGSVNGWQSQTGSLPNTAAIDDGWPADDDATYWRNSGAGGAASALLRFSNTPNQLNIPANAIIEKVVAIWRVKNATPSAGPHGSFSISNGLSTIGGNNFTAPSSGYADLSEEYLVDPFTGLPWEVNTLWNWNPPAAGGTRRFFGLVVTPNTVVDAIRLTRVLVTIYYHLPSSVHSPAVQSVYTLPVSPIAATTIVRVPDYDFYFVANIALINSTVVQAPGVVIQAGIGLFNVQLFPELFPPLF